jgi:heme exporter protein D
MIWASWGDFFAMGGYALYVWGSYAVCLGVLAAEIALVVQRRRHIDLPPGRRPVLDTGRSNENAS